MDVTSSCKSPMNTGVQRVVRGLHRSLSALTEVTPVLWSPSLSAYCTLSAGERGFLEKPFAGQRVRANTGDAEPGRRANPVPVWSKFVRAVTHRRNRLDLPACLTATDALFVPEIFQDNRVGWLANLGARTKARRVGVCHDAIAWRRPDITPPARQAGFAEYLDTLGTLNHVVAVSQETADELAACWRERGRTTVTPVTVFPWPVNHAGAERRVQPPPPLGRRAVLCVGTFEPRKNHLVLLDAAEIVWSRGEDFELVLVGRTTAQWGRRVLEIIERMQAAARPVRWLRHVNDVTLRRAYDECAFTVFPSLVEGFGLPIMESLWHGRPCVCGINGALGEVSAGGGCLPVDQTNAVALAGAMERLLADQTLYRRLCAEAAARKFMTWETLAESLLPILSGKRI